MKIIPIMMVLLLLNLQPNIKYDKPLPILLSKPIIVNTITRQMYVKNMKQNNPFNIRVNPANNWVGKIPTTNGFEAFDTLEHGIRAGLKLLQGYYYNKRGLNTVTNILHVYAPTIENDTDNYINIVCKYTGFKPNQQIDLNDRNTLIRLAEAMVFVETGEWLSPIASTYQKYFS